MLLFRSVILTCSSDAQSQHIAIKLQTCVGVTDDNRRVIDTEKKTILSLPFRVALAFGKLQDLQPVLVRIAKVESFDPAGILVPVRQPLRTGRGMLDLVLPE